MEVFIVLTIYNEKETNFNSLGLGVLPSPISLTITEELNGLYALDLEYPKSSPAWELLQGRRILKADGQLFRILEVEDDLDKVTVSADHIFYDLLDNLIEDSYIQNSTGAYAIQHLLKNTQYPHKFSGWSDVMEINNARLVRKNPVEAILSKSDNSFVNRWGGEIERDNFSIKLHRRLGSNNGVTIRYKKNLLGYKRLTDNRNLATRLMPKGFDGLLLPEKYVDSTLINNYSNPIIRVIDVPDAKVVLPENATDDEPAMSQDEAWELMRETCKELLQVQKVDIPKINISVDFVDLELTEEYKHLQILERVSLGDTVTVLLDDIGIKLEYRVIKVVKDILNKVNKKVEIGDFTASLYDFLNSNGGDSFGSGGSSGNGGSGGGDYLRPSDIPTLEKDFLDKAKIQATELINSGFGGYVKYYSDRILIMDTDNEMTARKVWQWNKNGLGYSSTGINGTYGLAMTNDGAIVADFIRSGELNGALIRAGSIVASHLTVAAKKELREGLVTENVFNVGLDGLTSKVKKSNNSNEIRNSTGRAGQRYWTAKMHYSTAAGSRIFFKTPNNISPNRNAHEFHLYGLNTRGGLLSDAFQVKAGGTYTITLKMESHRGSNLRAEILMFTTNDNSDNVSGMPKHILELTNAKTNSLTFKTQSDTAFIKVYVWGEYTDTNANFDYSHFWIKELRINEGEIAYNWSESINYSESTIAQLDNEIELKVDVDGVISAINLTEGNAKIKADKVVLDGLVTFQNLSNAGQTVINGDNITAGSITGRDLNGCNINGGNFRGTTSMYMEKGSFLSCDGNAYFRHFYVPKTHPDWQPGETSSYAVGCPAFFDDDVTAPGFKIGRHNVPYSEIGAKWVLASLQGYGKSNGGDYLQVAMIGGTNFGIDMWTSDVKLKDNVHPVNLLNKSKQIIGLELIKTIEHFNYNYKDNKNTIECGYIAQNLPNQWTYDVQQEDGTTLKHILASAIIPNITLAIQEQQQQIEQLTQENLQLKQDIQLIKQHLNLQ